MGLDLNGKHGQALYEVTREGQTEERLAARMDDDGGSPAGPRPPQDPSGHVTQEYES